MSKVSQIRNSHLDPDEGIELQTRGSRDGGRELPVSSRQASSPYAGIALHACFLSLPMLFFSAILLALVFVYRVKPTVGYVQEPLPEAGARRPGLSTVLFVNLRATYLIAFSPWSSTLAPLLTESVVALVSHRSAKTTLQATQAGRSSDLPTPHQLALTIRMIESGGWGPLLIWLKYTMGSGTRQLKQGRMLRQIGTALIVASAFGGVFVFVADTWLHLTTSSVNLLQRQAIYPPEFGFALDARCSIGNNSYDYQQEANNPCTIYIASDNTTPVQPALPALVLSNASDLATITTYSGTLDTTNDASMPGGQSPDKPIVYLTSPSAQGLQSLSYSAATYGVSTHCRFVSTQCHVGDNMTETYDCSSAFDGDFNNGMAQAYFVGPGMKDVDTTAGINNPFYMGLAVMENYPGNAGPTSDEIIPHLNGGGMFVLLCNTTTYDLITSYFNSSVTSVTSAPSNSSVANIVQVTAQIGFLNDYLQQSATFAWFSSSTAEELADQIALAYSRAALALLSMAVVPIEAYDARETTSMIVAKIHAAPLFALVVANLLYVVAGCFLLVVALASRGTDVRAARELISIEGLVAERFEQRKATVLAGELFEESKGTSAARIGVLRSQEGGYSRFLLDREQEELSTTSDDALLLDSSSTKRSRTHYTI